jgi:hypothetical protein
MGDPVTAKYLAQRSRRKTDELRPRGPYSAICIVFGTRRQPFGPYMTRLTCEVSRKAGCGSRPSAAAGDNPARLAAAAAGCGELRRSQAAGLAAND